MTTALKQARGGAAGKLAWLDPAVITGALVPLAALAIRASRGALGANAIAEALNQLGLLALILLTASLAATPLKILTGWTWPIRIRRTLGLLSFFYACLHFAAYAGLDQGLDLGAIYADLTKRPFIVAGALALGLLLPLAVTSTQGMLKRLGFSRWKRLHRLAYAAAGLGVVHFFLRVKKDTTEPALYAGILAVLLGARLVDWIGKRGQPGSRRRSRTEHYGSAKGKIAAER